MLKINADVFVCERAKQFHIAALVTEQYTLFLSGIAPGALDIVSVCSLTPNSFLKGTSVTTASSKWIPIETYIKSPKSRMTVAKDCDSKVG
eukprot:snap_masked-scaffold_21-processed-gene-2.21-mRNA-1 protein AED:1.00 eAED:1.00 QI:0/0/0/0/1/1/4/0/90